MDHDVEARLQRSGLDGDQIKTAFEEFDSLDAEGQAEFRRWMDSVSDPDIKARYGGTDAQVDATDTTAGSGSGFPDLGAGANGDLGQPTDAGPGAVGDGLGTVDIV